VEAFITPYWQTRSAVAIQENDVEVQQPSVIDRQAGIKNGRSFLLDLIQSRHSSRGGFDASRNISKPNLAQILAAARWAPTPSNMQNFEIIVVDDPGLLTALGKLPAEMSEAYLRGNFALISKTEDELRIRKVGTLASDYPPAWIDPEAWNPESDYRSQLTYLESAVLNARVLLVVTYDSSVHAPGSEGHMLGFIALGCVMENMWLMAESLSLSMHVHTVFSDEAVEKQVRSLLKMDPATKIAFACGLGYPVQDAGQDVRVRRELEDFIYHNEFGHKDVLWGQELSKQ
jgi:nitroreductase